MTQKPNFLIFMVDQLAGTLFADGPADFLHAPALRRLSNEAVNFTNAYCASPLCTPARASFMTGQLPSRNGVYDNAAELAADIPTFAHYLRQAGYRTMLSGKMHFVGADQLHGFEERLTTDIYPADFGWTPDWTRPDERIDWWYHNMSSVTNAGVAATTNQLEFDDDVAYQAKTRLYRLAREDRQTPFCLTVSFTHPHDPYVARQRFWDLYDDEVPMPRTGELSADQHDAHSRRLLAVSDRANYTISDAHIRRARRAYFANVSYLDSLIAEILETLKAGNLDENTVIVFCSDHGDMLGERGLWYKMSFHEPSIRVPLFVHAPGRFRPSRVDEPVSTLDVLPTLVELAGGDADDLADDIDGASLVPLLNGRHQPNRTVLAEFAAEGAVDPLIMMRDGRYKYVFGNADGAQLFDLSDDPQEMRDLAGLDGHTATVAGFADAAAARWDLAKFEADVLASQRRRRLVYDALRRGRYQPWDFQPHDPASERYMRNHLDLNELEARSRYPRE